MVTKDELKEKTQVRMMLRGDVGTGKTFTLVKLVKRYTRDGKKVLYIDFRDRGASSELEKLDDALLALVDYETPSTYKDLIETHIAEGVKLIIVDAIHHLRYASRAYIREEFIKHGHYTIGGKTHNISEENVFDLGSLGYGYGYNVANIRENDFIDMLMNSGVDIAVAVISEPSGDRPTFTDILMANFDNIIDLSFMNDEKGKREWLFSLYRWRGIETNDYSKQINDGNIDPFAIIEETGGKPVKEYMVRFKLAGKSKKEFITAIDAEEAEAALKAMYEEAEEIEVIL